MAKVRKLSDLFVVGKTVTFDDGQGAPVTVWLQKISPLDQQTAIRRANQERAKILARQGDDAAEWDISLGEAIEMSRESKLQFVVTDEVSKRIPAFEAEIGAEEEWTKDGYLQGMKDAWEEGLGDRYQMDNNDEEALHVYNEMKRYTKLVEERVDSEKEALELDFDTYTDEMLDKLVAERFLSAKADVAWLNEFRTCEMWMATRDPNNHDARLLDNREDIDHLAQPVILRLLNEYREMTMEPTEGKDSREPESSSSSSEQPAKQEPDSPSGPELELVSTN